MWTQSLVLAVVLLLAAMTTQEVRAIDTNGLFVMYEEQVNRVLARIAGQYTVYPDHTQQSSRQCNKLALCSDITFRFVMSISPLTSNERVGVGVRCWLDKRILSWTALVDGKPNAEFDLFDPGRGERPCWSSLSHPCSHTANRQHCSPSCIPQLWTANRVVEASDNTTHDVG